MQHRLCPPFPLLIASCVFIVSFTAGAVRADDVAGEGTQEAVQAQEVSPDELAEPLASEEEAAGAQNAEARVDTTEVPREDNQRPSIVTDDEAGQRALLRGIESGLSVGTPPTSEEDQAIRWMALHSADGPVRAMALSVLSWLSPQDYFDVVLTKTADSEERVRAEAFRTASLWGKRLSETQRNQLKETAQGALEDPSDEVACTAARAMVVAAPQEAAAHLTAISDGAGAMRYGCWRSLTHLPFRDVRVPAPQVTQASQLPDDVEPNEEEGQETQEGVEEPIEAAPQVSGNGLFWAASAGAGLFIGGAIPGLLSPPRDALIYRTDTTTKIREEPSYGASLGGSLTGALVMGGGAVLTTYLLGPMDYAAAGSVAALSLVGASAGAGLGLAAGLDDFWTSLATLGLGATGLTLGTVGALVKPPSQRDVTLMLSLSTLGTMAGTLATFTTLPVGVPVYFDRVLRFDLAVGAGMLSGAAGGGLGWLSSPLLDISQGRIIASSAAAMSAAGLGIATTYLLVPVSVDIRTRIAAGVGLASQLLVGSLAFALFPDSWAGFFERRDIPVGREAVVLEDGQIKVGVPGIQVFSMGYAGTEAPVKEGPSVGISLVGARF